MVVLADSRIPNHARSNLVHGLANEAFVVAAMHRLLDEGEHCGHTRTTLPRDAFRPNCKDMCEPNPVYSAPTSTMTTLKTAAIFPIAICELMRASGSKSALRARATIG